MVEYHSCDINQLNAMLKEMCEEAGLSTNFTNHSLRAYGATTLFQAGVSGKLIQQRTGHKCVKAFCQYERTSESQLADVSNVLSNPDTPGSANTSSVNEDSAYGYLCRWWCTNYSIKGMWLLNCIWWSFINC